ncbi:class I SAM-dependent methyltransferase [Algoriphagus sp.]|jgi:2-polyprenyl-3-methyl-5-hydroxy-6-metoxy-1,4-benzoquinol methylase|uniref:class I SAM-dependent methyltransferase n=1 Tax=Algoriphagus sp. TaxID=1872435 RepID=UPI0027224DF8|nr:class I SAM-dependent methyltransferase [Algoriphagus sp.]MDO8966560.1 class I SAM-dependent methyltransferase [Algoriphagus sp.]MDP3202006.1 class I SAM-dependent methyltransferase [Algoriphagus sp.]
MLERLSKCPLCKSGRFLNYAEITDHAVSKENFILCKCSNCELLFTNPRPTEDKIGPYYNFPEYYSHEDKAKNLTQWIYQKVRNFSISKKVDFIRRLKRKGKLLDYGCGTGEFLKAAKNKGWKISGIEPNEKARNQANLKLNEKVKNSIEELNKNSDYDIITLFHVLEHIHELRKTLKKIITHLKSDGYLIIAVPNADSWDGKKYGKYWAGWDVPRHLYHFNSKSIEALQTEFNLELKEIKPMKFDSFYVSLLSEGYLQKDSSLLSRYWSAFKAGIKSNHSAKTPGQFSSNIFVFQKK